MTNRLRLPIPILVALVSSGLPVLGQQTLTSQSDEGAVCQTYDPTKIQVIAPSRDPFADSSWKIESAGALLEQAANQPDADRVATLALYYAEECRIVSTNLP